MRMHDIAAIIGTASAGAVLFYLLFIFPAQWLKVERVREPLGLGIRVLQISDLHVDMLRISSGKLRRVIEREKPDYIFLTGDYTHTLADFPKLGRYLSAIAGVGVPVYAVLGNHDHQLAKISRMVGLFDQYGIRVLRNESLELPQFHLVGIDNDSTGHSRAEASFQRVREQSGKPIIVITHDPNVVLKIRRDYDYLMSGHLHGKQFNIPFFFKFKHKGALPARGIYKGLHRHDRGPFYISKGIGQAGINVRFLVRSEVTLHEL
ncbi:metallophosphoesterase [Paenibacillus soyae]|uniref:Metallophosphoesterase n=1 Tax=Paenibacillus soyae TaxID=2969249 RepID=A0A9X2MMT6_9BACL|nr:metallophosphoesterase [Paenibacillus soyae]MCR2802531.1 metallophosphoesterase [Paenibacillus soyae]